MTPQEKIDALKNEIQVAMSSIATISVENEIATCMDIGGRGFQVFLGDDEYIEDLGYERGEWISSSEMC